jgi:hypothetical protein
MSFEKAQRFYKPALASLPRCNLNFLGFPFPTIPGSSVPTSSLQTSQSFPPPELPPNLDHLQASVRVRMAKKATTIDPFFAAAAAASLPYLLPLPNPKAPKYKPRISDVRTHDKTYERNCSRCSTCGKYSHPEPSRQVFVWTLYCSEDPSLFDFVESW